jgi:DNA polymerase III epsilon subunit-like protein
MNYCFFDIECANCYGGKGKICSFGYVITDDQFNILEKKDIVINPRSSFNLGPDLKLAYTKAEFRQAAPFPDYYDEIGALLEYPEYVILGYSIENDCNFLRSDCKRYNLPCFEFPFYDVQCMIMQMFDLQNMPSLQKALEFFGMHEDQEIHKSDDDAYMTMLAMKGACIHLGITPAELLERFAIARGTLKDYEIHSNYKEERERQRALRDAERQKAIADANRNRIRYNSPNFHAFQRHLKRLSVMPGDGVLDGERVCLSSGYEKNNYRQMLKITELIAANGGKYVQKASQCSLFVACEEIDGTGNVMPDKRRSFVENAIEEGNPVRVILLPELLAMLGTTEEELNALPLPEDASGTPAAPSQQKKKKTGNSSEESKPIADEVISEDELTVEVDGVFTIEDTSDEIVTESV